MLAFGPESSPICNGRRLRFWRGQCNSLLTRDFPKYCQNSVTKQQAMMHLSKIFLFLINDYMVRR